MMLVQPMRLLVLGGTRFLGRAFVDAALARGHELTLFNRGRTNPELFPNVPRLQGDRTADVSMLAGGQWDAVVDVAAYHPRTARLSAETLCDSVGRYLLVSSVSVYADQSVPQHEDAPLLELVDWDDASADSYGARKAACEQEVARRFGARSTIVR